MLTQLDNAITAAALPEAGSNLLIALDLDGTLVRHDNTVTERVKAALSAHLQFGTHIVIATGRGIAGTQEAMTKLGLANGLAVCSNGAILLAVGTYTQHYQQEVSPQIKHDTPPVKLISATTFNPANEIALIHQKIPQAIMAVEPVADIRRVSKEFPPGELSGKSLVVPVSQLAHKEACRLTVRVPDMSVEELFHKVEELGLHSVEYSIGYTAWLDIYPPGLSKATGLTELARILKVDTQNTVSIGDSGNDCEMLQWAKLGVAMGNAPQYVASYAQARTESVDKDGAAVVLEKLLP